MKKFTVFCISPELMDTIWRGVVEAENIEEAKTIAQEKASDDCGTTFNFTFPVLVLSGEVEPLYISEEVHHD